MIRSSGEQGHIFYQRYIIIKLMFLPLYKGDAFLVIELLRGGVVYFVSNKLKKKKH
jgi:hypothetical protein